MLHQTLEPFLHTEASCPEALREPEVARSGFPMHGMVFVESASPRSMREANSADSESQTVKA